MWSSCGERPSSWTVMRRERRPSMSDGSRTAQKWQRMTKCTCSPTAPFTFRRWRAEEETNQMKGFISASLRTNMVRSWARKPVLQSQVSIAFNIYFERIFKVFCPRGHLVVLLAVFRGLKADQRETIGVLMKEKHRSGAVQDPGSTTQRTDDPLFTEWGLSCYCTGMAWGIVLLECFFLQRFVGWPHILKEKWRSYRPSGSFGTWYLHLRSRPCFWVFHFHPADIPIYFKTFLSIIVHQNVKLSALCGLFWSP